MGQFPKTWVELSQASPAHLHGDVQGCQGISADPCSPAVSLLLLIYTRLSSIPGFCTNCFLQMEYQFHLLGLANSYLPLENCLKCCFICEDFFLSLGQSKGPEVGGHLLFVGFPSSILPFSPSQFPFGELGFLQWIHSYRNVMRCLVFPTRPIRLIRELEQREEGLKRI